MADKISRYRFFIASPSGLEEERRKFFEVVNNFNQYEALPEGIYFEPVGWEFTLGGVGRPQSQINREIETCDYFALVLYDRWGSSPDSEGVNGYSSATEEEYSLAMNFLSSDKYPMSEIIAFFKNVDAPRLADPGPQLKKVIDFKKTLEKDKIIFFQTFDNIEIYSERIRNYLSKWLRNIKEGTLLRDNTINRDNETINLLNTDPHSPDNATTEKVKMAKKYAKQGLFTDAEMIFSDLALNSKSPYIYHEYGSFLATNGLVKQALVVFKNSQKLAQERSDDYYHTMDLANCGKMLQSIGKLREAESIQEDCLKLFIKKHDNQNIALGYINLLDIKVRLNPKINQEPYWQKIIQYSNKSKSFNSIAETSLSYAYYLIKKEKYTDANKLIIKAETIALRQNDFLLKYEVRLSKQFLRYKKNEDIEDNLKQILEEFKTLGLISLTAKTLYRLGKILQDKNKLEEAMQSVKEGINYFIFTGSIILIADGYMHLAAIAKCMKNYQLRKCYLDIALDKYRQLGVEDIFYRDLEQEDNEASNCD